MKKKNLLNVILSFSKIGAIGFGGGAALIPIIESELVEKNKWMEKDRFDVAVATASISPASLPVSICAIWNLKYSLFSAYFYALPGPVIFMILLTGFSMIGEAGVRHIEYASAGILVFVLLLIYKFVRKNYLHSIDIGIKKEHILIFLASFILFGGNAVRNFITLLFALEPGTLPGSVFALSMLDLILLLFFIVCFVGASKSKVKLGAAILMTGLYALANGRMGILAVLSIPLVIIMPVMALASVFYDISKRDKTQKAAIKLNYKPLINIVYFLLLAVGLTALTYFVSGRDANAWYFAFRGVTSSLTSFGGGEVYYAIAEETFVETGFICGDFYFSRIIGIAGAMPGPVIVSILAGVGFAYGSDIGGAALGWMFGLLGASMAITATALGASSLFTVFEIMRDSPRLKMIIKYIMPLVCGVLVSVALTLLRRAAVVIASAGINPLIAFGAVIIMFSLMLFANKKFRVNDMVLFLIGGVITLAGLNIANHFVI